MKPILDTAQQMEKDLREGKVDRTKAAPLVRLFVEDHRKIIIIVREKFPEHLEWTNDLESLLDKLENSASSS